MSQIYPTAWIQFDIALEDFGQPDPSRIITLSGEPASVRVERNAFNEADTAEVVLDFEDFPFDPRIVRGGIVQVFLADAGEVNQNFWPARTAEQLRDLIVFVGVIDRISSTFNDKHRQFRVEARDYTAYFLDAEIGVTAHASFDFKRNGEPMSLVEIIETVVQDPKRPQTHEIEVEVRDGIPDIFPADYMKRGGTEKVGSRLSRNGETIWGFFTELALYAGVIVYVELDKIVIRRPRTLFVDGVDSERLSTWTVGQNVMSLVKRRALGRQTGIKVIVTSYDPDTKKTRRAEQGEDVALATELVAPKVGNTSRTVEEPPARSVRLITVRGITSQPQLDEIAEQYFELLRHQEMEAVVKTHEMRDSTGRPVQQLCYGDPVTFQISDSAEGFGFIPIEAQVRHLIERGYSPETAEAVTVSLDRMRVPFYVHRVEYQYDSAQGFELELEMRSRRQVDLSGVS